MTALYFVAFLITTLLVFLRKWDFLFKLDLDLGISISRCLVPNNLRTPSEVGVGTDLHAS